MNGTQTPNTMNKSTNYAQSAAIEALESVRFMLQAEMARNEGDNPKQVRAWEAARIELNKVRKALDIVKGVNIA
jgi:signal-transduction protein with cAMP-binding, CBS, and nucleotidyltransferase domain